MAVFNPDLNKVQADYTGSSRYWDTIAPVGNTAGAALGESLGKTFGLAVGAVDESIQQNIRDEATQMSDSIYDEFGVGDAATQETDAENPTQPLPVELERARNNLGRLQAARQRGELKESTFYSRMTSMSRQLRARYPGYREQVDNIVQSVTGIKPANSLRTALMSEFDEAAKNQSDGVKQRQQLVVAMSKDGTLPIDFYEREKSGNPYPDSALIMRQNKIAADERYVTSRKAQYELNSAEGKAKVEDAESMFTQESTNLVTQFTNDMTDVIGKDFSQVKERINAISRRASGGGLGASADEQQQIGASLNQIKTNLRERLLQRASAQWANSPGYRTYNTEIKNPETINKIIDQAMMPVQNIIDAAGAGQWNIFSASTAWTKAVGAEDGQKLLMSDGGDTLRRHMAIKETLGPDAYNWYLGNNTAAKTEFNAAVRYSAQNKVVSGDVPLGRVLEEAKADGADSSDLVAVLNNTSRVLATFDESNMKAAQQVAKSAFGPENYDAFNKIEKADRVKFFTQLTSPQVTKGMQRLRDSGDTQTYEAYRQWSLNAFQALFRQQAQDLQGIQTSEAYRVAFNPTRNAFVPVNRDGTFLRPQSPAEQAEVARVNGVLNSFNQSIQSIVPLLEEEDSNVMAELGPLMRSMGINLQAGQTPSLFQSMSTALSEAVSSLSGLTDGADSADAQRKEQAGKVFNRLDTQQMTNTLMQQEARPSSALPFNAENPLSNEGMDAINSAISTPQKFEAVVDDIADKYVGLREDTHKDIISSFIKTATGKTVDPTITPWCAAFANSVIQANGGEGTGSLMARSFLQWGKPVDSKPKKGDIVVFQRGSGNVYGHVGFYMGEDKNGDIQVLGGNQSNKVSVQTYSRNKLLGIRRMDQEAVQELISFGDASDQLTQPVL